MKLYKEQYSTVRETSIFSLTELLTFGVLWLQQSSLGPVWLFLNEIIVKKLTSLKHLVRTTVAELHN